MKEVKINPEAWYSLKDIVTERMVPFALNFRSMRAVLKHDRKTDDLLQPVITGTKQSTKYHFRGENIIKFLTEASKAKPWHFENKKTKTCK